ncbi:hypothetical protein, partial [Syntrophothermus sp.]|uniref:hypothetical protein n=1 Tax=Syntrophothermus sp. TaxID=2736299 RepID=UPI00257F69CD
SLSSCSYVCFALHSLQERSVGVVNFFVVIFCSGGQLLRYQKQELETVLSAYLPRRSSSAKFILG